MAVPAYPPTILMAFVTYPLSTATFNPHKTPSSKININIFGNHLLSIFSRSNSFFVCSGNTSSISLATGGSLGGELKETSGSSFFCSTFLATTDADFWPSSSACCFFNWATSLSRYANLLTISSLLSATSIPPSMYLYSSYQMKIPHANYSINYASA